MVVQYFQPSRYMVCYIAIHNLFYFLNIFHVIFHLLAVGTFFIISVLCVFLSFNMALYFQKELIRVKFILLFVITFQWSTLFSNDNNKIIIIVMLFIKNFEIWLIFHTNTSFKIVNLIFHLKCLNMINLIINL